MIYAGLNVQGYINWRKSEYEIKIEVIEETDGWVNKISELIKELQNIQKNNGDLDCYYSVDDEGNGYRKIEYSPTIMFKLTDEENELRGLGEFNECVEEHEAEFEFGKDDEDFEPLEVEYGLVCKLI